MQMGYFLSYKNRLDDLRSWLILGILAIVISAIFFYRKLDPKKVFINIDGVFTSLMNQAVSIKNWCQNDLSRFEKVILFPLLVTTIMLGLLNLIVVIFSAPHEWDSMTYHLARVAYFLQHNQISHFDANYWAQVAHPKGSSLLLLFSYLISYRNENFTQLVQFTAYWVSVCSVYAISRRVGHCYTTSLFAALVSALLINWLMQASTTQNDLIITAYIGASVYSLFAYKETQHWKYLGLTALGLGLSIATKASSFLAMPSIILIAMYVFYQNGNDLYSRIRPLLIFTGFTLIAICMFALPSGYIENLRHFGHPLGPPPVRSTHSFEGSSTGYIVLSGTKNLVRFGFDSLSLDGLPSISPIRSAQLTLRFIPKTLIRTLGVNLETPPAANRPFNLSKMPEADEDGSYWGILGLGLVWVVVVLSAVGLIHQADLRILSFAAILFFLTQAYAGPYDPWRGRYFTTWAVFAVPTVGIALKTTNRLLKSYLVIIILLGCIAAITAVILKNNSALVTLNYDSVNTSSIFGMNRMEQLTRNRSYYSEALTNFDQLVPKDAKVAVFLQGNSYEYPLFGEYLTRTILPINSFQKGAQPIPSNAEYLIYTQKKFPCPLQDDIHLGEDLYLRRLTDSNSRCR